MAKVLVKKLNSKVQLPKYKTKGSSGMDLMAFIDESIEISPNSSMIIPTGISVAIEEGYENFCTIEFNFKTLEFLYLQKTGHRRCKFSWNAKGKKESYWLVP